MVAICGPQEQVIWRKGDMRVEELVQHLSEEVDVVLVEGFSRSSLPKVWVGQGPPPEGVRPVALVPPGGIEEWGEKLVKMIEEGRLQGPPIKEDRIELKVDGERIYLKPFVEEILTRTIMGMVTTLKGCEQATKVEITIRRSTK